MNLSVDWSVCVATAMRYDVHRIIIIIRSHLLQIFLVIFMDSGAYSI